MKSKPDIKQFVSVKTAAEALDCTEKYIYQLISLGTLIGIKIGSRAIRVSLESLNAFIEGNMINPEDYRVTAAAEEAYPEQKPRHAGSSGKIARSNWMSIDRNP
jgi:excisionase family DNA binding protein